MKFKLVPWVAATCLMSGLTMPLMANAADEASADKLLQRTQELEKEMRALKQQIKLLKSEQKHSVSTVAKEVKAQEQKHQNLVAAHTEEDVKHLTPVAKTVTAEYLKGTSVITSPYLGVHSAFDGTDLLVLAPNANLDRRLLLQEQKLENYYNKSLVPLSFENGPLLVVSGRIEGQALVKRPYSGAKKSDVDLTAAELDLIPIFNNWVTGFMAFNYDNAATTAQRISNSRLYVNKAFLTVGNFNTSPFYASVGQMVLPFHQYSSYMITSPMSQLLGDFRNRALLLGYMHPGDQGFYGSVYAFKGDSHASTNNNSINNGGLNLGYQLKVNDWKAEIGAGYVGNLADSLGMQATGAPSGGFTGFNSSAAAERLDHRVPGLGVHATFGSGPINLMAEYEGATTSFSSNDMTFNNHGAKPQALALEANYAFKIGNKPSNVGLGYARTREALAINLPEQRYSLVFNTSIWQRTIASLEFRHDINYGGNSSATGAGLSAVTAGDLGKTSDQLIAQFGVYF